MKPHRTIYRRYLARGIGLVTAIFLLVVLAGLAVAIVSVTTTQQASVAMDLQGVRAYQSARAGMEWALYGLQPQSAPAVNPFFNPCTGYTFAMPTTSTLSAFTVTVSCPATTSTPLNGVNVVRTRILSVACNQPSNGACPNASPGADYVERQVEAEVEQDK